MLRTRVRAGITAGIVVSLVFALLVTVLQTFDTFVPALAPHLGEPTPVTLRVPYAPRITRVRSAAESVSYEHVRVVVRRGTVLREDEDDHRAAFAFESLRRPTRLPRVISLCFVNFMLAMLLVTYFRRYGQNRIRLLRPQIGLFCVMFLVLCFGKALLLATALPEFWMPIGAVPLWVALSFDRRTAILVTVALSFLAASLLRFDIMLLTIMLVRGIAASVLFLSVKHTRQMIYAGAAAGAFSAVLYVAIATVFEGHFAIGFDLSQGLASILVACIGGGAFSGVVANLLHQPVERMLGHVPRDQLLDLADLEQPLLQKMAREAPGSWEHSRAMANLAEAASAAIGADALLTRVGAYYHDLGKTTQCKYFVENLEHGEASPHLELEPDVSADAIMAHVVLGTKILREGGVPEPVVEFCYTHHGTQLVEFFWHKCKEQGNPKNLTEDHFRYPGMKPQSKETAILMLVDSIEAASRTIDPPERAKFEEMIQRIIFSKLRAGQLDESGLSVEDLRVLTTRMSDTLVNMYHSRIKYPWQKKEGEKPAS